MKKFGMILSILAIMAFIAVPAMAKKHHPKPPKTKPDSYMVSGNAAQANGGTIMSGDVIVKPSGKVLMGGPNDGNGAFLSGWNTSEGAFKDTTKDPWGITGAAGATYGAVNTNYRGPDGNYPLPYTEDVLGYLTLDNTPILTGNWKGSFAAGITAGGSFALKGCNNPGDFTKVSGEGNIAHGTYTVQGANSAWTSGSAGYAYNGKTKGDFIAGGGVAATGGYSGISVSNGTTSMFAVSGSVAGAGITTSWCPIGDGYGDH